MAIDGPDGSGKSTIAKALARDYKILYLDTGAMYRACALKALEAQIDIQSEKEVEEILRVLSLEVKYEDGTQKTILDGIDVSDKIRAPEISMAASTVSRYPFVRLKMAEKQREIASDMSCVLDGRDIGTFVLPSADFKFFLTASPEVRAERRKKELEEKGYEVDFEKLKEEIIARDNQDMNREIAPLKQADDAVLIDTSSMTIEQVLQTIKKMIQEKI